jgi:hypothetical protein
MSWLDKDSSVRYAPEHMPSSPLQRYKSAGEAQPSHGLSAVEWFEWWLHTSRSVIDIWQMTVRQQQDTFVRTWRNALSTPTAKPGAQREPPSS